MDRNRVQQTDSNWPTNFFVLYLAMLAIWIGSGSTCDGIYDQLYPWARFLASLDEFCSDFFHIFYCAVRGGWIGFLSWTDLLVAVPVGWFVTIIILFGPLNSFTFINVVEPYFDISPIILPSKPPVVATTLQLPRIDTPALLLERTVAPREALFSHYFCPEATPINPTNGE